MKMRFFDKIFDKSLGQDFWKFRLGQGVSLLGDSCSTIAMAWWILDKTGSAAKMSSVLAPAMLVRIFLLPLFGPIGDRFSRKHLIITSEVWRFFFTAVIASLVFFNYFNLVFIIGLNILNSIGAALFNPAVAGIIPQLVPRDKIESATQQTMAMTSFSNVIGGILGGAMVSFIGVFGAFVIDALSYLFSAFCTWRIKAHTTAAQEKSTLKKSAFALWKKDLSSGFRILFKIPVLFWLGVLAMFLNLSFAPMSVVLPVLAKESRNMPAWFLGGLESSIGVGAILGAYSFASLKKIIRADLFLVFSIIMIGIGVFVLPLVSNLFLPLSIMFWIGIGVTWTNIPLGSQISISLPDAYRSRIGSIIDFLCNGISPLGVAAIGLVISKIGLSSSLFGMGIAVIVLAPLILVIPNMKAFMRSSPEETAHFFEKHYPGIL